jgi:predicted nucleotide-binding protein
MADNNAALSSIDQALDHWKQVRSKSRWEDCSDRPEDEISELIFTLTATIDRFAPTGARYRQHLEDSLKQLGPNNPHLLTILPGMLKALRKEYGQQGSGSTVADANDHTAKPDPRKVFVVHGRNSAARRAMFTFLRAIGLEPIEWNQALSYVTSGSPYIGEVIDQAFARAQAVVVLITGDDVARLGTRFQQPTDPPYERELTPQARPNVLFEAGLAFGRHPARTILAVLGRVRPFSDVVGRHIIAMSNSLEHRQTLADRLRSVGCSVDTNHRTDWQTEGEFDEAALEPDPAA